MSRHRIHPDPRNSKKKVIAEQLPLFAEARGGPLSPFGLLDALTSVQSGNGTHHPEVTVDMLRFEKLLWAAGMQAIAGVDEAGVGSLAGPVIAAAVVFPPGLLVSGVNDSKLLREAERAELETVIQTKAVTIGIGAADVEEIDRLNIYRASLLAMRRAVKDVALKLDYLLVDARHIPDIDIPQTAITRGDRLSHSIAAASIIAKTHRDRLMKELSSDFPGYGFSQHKGYATPSHQEAIRRLGASRIHRQSYKVFRELSGSCSAGFYTLRQMIREAADRSQLRQAEASLDKSSELLTSFERTKLREIIRRRKRKTGI